MDRSFAKLATALLLGTALTACSTMGGTEGGSAPKDAKAAPAQKSLAADLETQIHNAQGLRASGDYAGATKALAQLMLVSPDDSRVAGEYGKALVLQGRSKEALDFLKRAVQLQPNDWSFYSAIGVAYDQQGDYTNASAAYTQALTLKPRDPGVLNNFALSRMQAKDLTGARQLLAQLPPNSTSDPKIAQNIALLASLSPQHATAAAPVTASASGNAKATPIAVHALPKAAPFSVQFPPDIKTASAHEATGKPHVLAKNASAPATAAAVKTQAKAASHKTAVAAADAKKTPAANANKTPALRMTADAATP